VDILFHTKPDVTHPSPKNLLKKFVRKCSKNCNHLFTLTISLGGVVALVYNEVFRLVVFPTREV
jgi:hypothetical protein